MYKISINTRLGNTSKSTKTLKEAVKLARGVGKDLPSNTVYIHKVGYNGVVFINCVNGVMFITRSPAGTTWQGIGFKSIEINLAN